MGRALIEKLRAACGVALLAAVSLVGLGPASAAPAAPNLLSRVFRNPRSVPHTGIVQVRVLIGTGSVSMVRVTCDGRGRELRQHLEGPTRGLEVLTDGRSTWQRSAGQRLWTCSQGLVAGEGAWEHVQRNYRFQQQGPERVAGRMAYRIAIIPIHAGNPRQVLWVDAACALILRSESYTSAGKLAVATAYTKVMLGKPRPDAIGLPAPSEVEPGPSPQAWVKCSSLEELRQRLDPVPVPTRLPPGYVPVGFSTHPCRLGGELPVVRYSDGLNALTLFVTRGGSMGRGGGRGFGWGRRAGPGRGFGWGRGRRGPCVVEQVDGQQVARTTYGGLTYVLVGDHSPEGLEAVLKSIQ